MPAVGPVWSAPLHGNRAVVSVLFIPAGVRNPASGPPGPNAYFVRLHNGASPSASLRSLQRIVNDLDLDPNAAPMSVLSVQRPAEIVNYRTMGSTPLFWHRARSRCCCCAGLTLIASVRRRRRDFAVFRTLVLPSSAGSVVAWQSSVAAAIGTIVGVPLASSSDVPLEPLRPRNRRSSGTVRPGAVDCPHCHWSDPSRKHRRCRAWTYRRPHPCCPAPES